MADRGEPKPERLFIGVPVTDDARNAIARALPRSLPGKPVLPDNWHFTLRFLGATSPAVRDSLITSLSAAQNIPRFQIRFGQLGAFPSPRRARVLWLGVERGGDKLSALAKVAESAAQSAGFDPENRDFTPHLTLSRLDPAASVATLLAAKPKIDVAMPIDAVILYRSLLGGGPPRYEELAAIILKR
jgi:RNA 2',3'-cyclic 3'-phosphodiesterase